MDGRWRRRFQWKTPGCYKEKFVNIKCLIGLHAASYKYCIVCLNADLSNNAFLTQQSCGSKAQLQRHLQIPKWLTFLPFLAKAHIFFYLSYGISRDGQYFNVNLSKPNQAYSIDMVDLKSSHDFSSFDLF